jgi:hypothetical protein
MDALHAVAPFDVDELVHDEPLLHIAVKHDSPDAVMWLLSKGSKAATIPTKSGADIITLAKKNSVLGILQSWLAKWELSKAAEAEAEAASASPSTATSASASSSPSAMSTTADTTPSVPAATDTK